MLCAQHAIKLIWLSKSTEIVLHNPQGGREKSMNLHTFPDDMDHSVAALSSPGSLVRQSRSKRLGFISYFFNCLYIARQRKDLLDLDDAALKDIGISRYDAHREANRSLWDIPETMKLKCFRSSGPGFATSKHDAGQSSLSCREWLKTATAV
jgi:hypothetical protein